MNRRRFMMSLCFSPVLCLTGQDAPGRGIQFQPGNRFVACYFGNIVHFGGYIYQCYLLDFGELVIDYNFIPPTKNDFVSIRNTKTLFDPIHGVSEQVLEYRTSRIVPGTIKLNSEHFVPTIGEKVVSFETYKEGMNRVYNIPGYFAWDKKHDTDPFFNRKTKTYSMSNNHKALLRTSVEPLPSHYYHKKLIDKIGEVVCFGTIMDNGNFNYDIKTGIIRDPEAIKKLKLPPNLYAVRENEEFVYEFRSERLILGKVTGASFVPELGSVIVSYDDYLNKKLKPLRIYNLPEKYKK